MRDAGKPGQDDGADLNARLTDIYELAPDSLAILDGDGRLLRLNRWGLQVAGISASANLAGSSWLRWWHPACRQAARAALERARAGSVAQFEGRGIIGGDGEQPGPGGGEGAGMRWWSVVLVRLPAQDGRPTILFAPHRDIEIIKRQEAEQGRRELVARRLIGIVSHDLRSPIAAILLTAARLWRLAPPDPSRRRPLARIRDAAWRAERMVHDLLDFTQAELGGGLAARLELLAIAGVLDPIIDELRAAHPGRAIVCHHDRGTALVDGARLAQVVTNLAGNALQHGTPDVPVTVRAWVAGTTLYLTVHNAGQPIAPALLPRIFDFLRRGDHPRAAGGLGLGLFIVQEIVTAHGGILEVRSTEAEGTLFSARMGPPPP